MIRNGVVISVKCENKYLLLKRSKDDSYAGIWEFPAGNVKNGEKLKNAAKRELSEETGIRKNVKYKGYVERIGKDIHMIFHIFEASISQSEKDKIYLSREHSDYCFMNKKEIKDAVKERRKKIGLETIAVISKSYVFS